jgi:hypothetical protein
VTTDAGWRREILTFAPIYFFFSLINLRLKLRTTPGWLDGELAENHALLLARAYTNNEQSRLFQFLVPELLVRVLGVSVEHAYLLQRWAFVWLGFVLFHFYLRRWFGRGLALGGVCILAAVLPLTHYTDLQESAPFLMVSFLAGLWSIRDGPEWLVALVLMLGALNNETTLVLPAVYFFFHLRGCQLRQLWAAGWRTLAVAAPAYAVTALIRYVNRDRPHLGGAWHLPDNVGGLLSEIQYSPLDYHRADYLCVVFIFGVLWCYAYLGFSGKPPFIRATLLMLPFFLLGHLITGIIFEVRQLVPMAYVVIPAAFCWLFPDEIRCPLDTSSLSPHPPSRPGPDLPAPS